MAFALLATRVGLPWFLVALVKEVEVDQSSVPRPRNAFMGCPPGAKIGGRLDKQAFAARAKRRPRGRGSGVVEMISGLEPIAQIRWPIQACRDTRAIKRKTL